MILYRELPERVFRLGHRMTGDAELGGRAEAAWLRAGDILVSADGYPATDPAVWMAFARAMQGRELPLVVRRGQTRRERLIRD